MYFLFAGQVKTPLDSSAYCKTPPSTGTGSPQPISSGAVLNKGSSNTANQYGVGDTQTKQDASSPKRCLKRTLEDWQNGK